MHETRQAWAPSRSALSSLLGEHRVSACTFTQFISLSVASLSTGLVHLRANHCVWSAGRLLHTAPDL